MWVTTALNSRPWPSRGKATLEVDEPDVVADRGYCSSEENGLTLRRTRTNACRTCAIEADGATGVQRRHPAMGTRAPSRSRPEAA